MSERAKLSQSSAKPGPVDVSRSIRSALPAWKGLFGAAGILAILCGAGSSISMLAGAMLYRSGYPATAEAYLQLVSQHQALANFLWSWWIFGDFLMILPTLGVYLVLRRTNRMVALVGTLVVGFYLFYDISITELNSLTLVSLSQGYAEAGTDALRASFVSAAAYGYAALPLQTVLSFGVGSVGWLFWCFPVSRSVFGRKTAIYGAIVNVVGVIGAAAPVTGGAAQASPLGVFQFFAPPLIGIWFVALGIRMYTHRKQLSYESD